METCSYGKVIDALVAIAEDSGVPQRVYDGQWDATNTPDEFVAVGLAALAGDETSVGGQQAAHAFASPLVVKEDYSVVCEIFVWSGSTKAQKKVRDRALTILAVFETALRTNPALVDPVLAGATVGGVQLTQVSESIDKGRFCRIQFDVSVSNVLGN